MIISFLIIQNMNNPNITALVKSEKSTRKRMRYLALLHFTDGYSRTLSQACSRLVERV
ncbi:transcriptional regulator [Shewanella putrefaciens]|nr:transcriptional regulator [Shewanella putrefaciens]